MMANYMIVRQRVTDLTRFQTIFDRLKPNREAAGLTDLGQFCAADEADAVIVVMEVEDISRAEEYWHSDVLEGRTEAGIVAHIDAKSDQVWLTDGLVKDRLTKPKRRRRPVVQKPTLRGLAEQADGENSSCKRKTEKGI